jgi:hypothetical protein
MINKHNKKKLQNTWKKTPLKSIIIVIPGLDFFKLGRGGAQPSFGVNIYITSSLNSFRSK